MKIQSTTYEVIPVNFADHSTNQEEFFFFFKTTSSKKKSEMKQKIFEMLNLSDNTL